MMAEVNETQNEKMGLQNAQSGFPTHKSTAKVNLTGNLGRNFVTPRGLKAHLINQLVKVQGIVTRMSIVRPKLQKSFHYCDKTKQGIVKSYSDQYSIGGKEEFDGNSTFPTTDAAGNPMTPDYGFMDYEDTQKLVI